jgi:hypothetical protein
LSRKWEFVVRKLVRIAVRRSDLAYLAGAVLNGCPPRGWAPTRIQPSRTTTKTTTATALVWCGGAKVRPRLQGRASHPRGHGQGRGRGRHLRHRSSPARLCRRSWQGHPRCRNPRAKQTVHRRPSLSFFSSTSAAASSRSSGGGTYTGGELCDCGGTPSHRASKRTISISR